MLKFERVLAAGSTELPDCRCSVEMHLSARAIPSQHDQGDAKSFFSATACIASTRRLVTMISDYLQFDPAIIEKRQVYRLLTARAASLISRRFPFSPWSVSFRR
jgi:hypothetical protein